MKTLTVFTPTYNRAYCLYRVYESLCIQTNPDFIWLIIDDGSSDNTGELVNSWIDESKIDIEYIYQDNIGMHGGYNTAYENIKTELNVCIDSDDFLTDTAVEKIIHYWEKYGSDKYAGIVGLDATLDNKILGKKFPENLHSSTLEDLYHKHNVPGDKKLVFRTEVVKQYPQYPVFKGESFVPLGALYILIDQDYELLCLNEVLCKVEYMEDGSTRNIFKQYYRHPKGFKYSRIVTINYTKYFNVRFKNLIHYVSHSLQLKELKIFRKNKYPILTIFAIPFGILLYFYVKYFNKKNS